MASKIIRCGKTPLGNLIHHRPTIVAIANANANGTSQLGAGTVYNRNYLFPPNFGPRVESPNQAVSKSANGNQFGLWAFSGLDHKSRVQVLSSPKEKDWDSDSDSDSDSYDDGDLIKTDWDGNGDGSDSDYGSELDFGSDDE